MALSVELPEILDAHHRAKMDEVHTALPGRIVAYYPATQTADVQPTIRRVSYAEDGTRADDEFPVLPHVPVCWPSGGGFFLSFPLAVGDHVLVVFSEGATGDWRVSGNTSSPSEVTRHGLNGAFAIPGANPDAKALKDASATDIIIGKDNTNIQISINGSAITLGKGTADFVALSQKVDSAIAAIVAKFNAHTHIITMTAPAGAAGTAAVPAGPMAISTQPSVAATLVKAV